MGSFGLDLKFPGGGSRAAGYLPHSSGVTLGMEMRPARASLIREENFALKAGSWLLIAVSASSVSRGNS